MRFDDVMANAQHRPPFANGTEWDVWSFVWCEQCVNEPGCPLIDVAIVMERTPAEWVIDIPGSLHSPYRCTEFEPREADD